jgi:hypothetical protein
MAMSDDGKLDPDRMADKELQAAIDDPSNVIPLLPLKGNGGQKRKLRLVLFRDIDPAPRKVYVVNNTFGVGEVSCIFGAPGAGKSILAVDWGLHVAADMEWFGRKVRRGAVLYVAAERAKLVERRCAAFKKHYCLTDLPFVIVSGQIDLRSSRETVDEVMEWAKEVEAEFGLSVVLIVVDTVSRALNGGDENSPKDMGLLIANITALQEASTAHIGLVHHNPIGELRLRGHSSLLGALDTTISVEKVGDTRYAKIEKDNDGNEDGAFHFKLESVHLFTDEDGNETHAPVVKPLEGRPANPTGRRRLSDRDQLALNALADLCADGTPSPASWDLPRGVLTVSIE